MNKQRFRFYGLLLLAGSMFFVGGCRREHKKKGPSLEEVLHSQRAPRISQASFRRVQEISLDKTVSVRWNNPKREFRVLKRTPHIRRFPCNACHVGKPKRQTPMHFRATHGKIAIKHGGSGVLKCSTCHDSKDMQKLKLPNGGRVDLDHSHLLCASCHTSRSKDWAGGGHGKRAYYWAGKRVIRACTSCHNPHSPLFGKRWPKTYFRGPAK